MYSRLQAELGTLDDEAVRTLKMFYQQIFVGTPSDYKDEEAIIHASLTTCGQHFTPQQRYDSMRIQFGHRTEGQLTLQLFDNTYPQPHQRTLVNLHALFIEQEPNIKRAMTRSHAFPGMAAAAISGEPSAFDTAGTLQHSAFQQLLDGTASLNVSGPPLAQQSPSPVPPMYSEAQMHEFAFRAIAAAQQLNPTTAGMNNLLAVGQRYCHVHGWGTHTGSNCKHNKTGMACRYKRYDSRNGPTFDDSRVIGHVNCQHTPKCISAARAKSATGPFTYPDTPGNEQVYTGSG
jgi:hypothetical protein